LDTHFEQDLIAQKIASIIIKLVEICPPGRRVFWIEKSEDQRTMRISLIPTYPWQVMELRWAGTPLHSCQVR